MRRVQPGIMESLGPVPRFPRRTMRNAKMSGALGRSAMQVDRRGAKAASRGEREGSIVGPHRVQATNQTRNLPRLIMDGLEIRGSAKSFERPEHPVLSLAQRCFGNTVEMRMMFAAGQLAIGRQFERALEPETMEIVELLRRIRMKP